jgi:peptidoglycan hydrolase CwlO-like protein
MQVLLIALTEGERIGLLGLVGVCITAAASISAVVIGQKVRRENSDQHGESQRLLSDLHSAVTGHGDKIDDLRDDVRTVARRVDHAHERIDNTQRRRRWW